MENRVRDWILELGAQLLQGLNFDGRWIFMIKTRKRVFDGLSFEPVHWLQRFSKIQRVGSKVRGKFLITSCATDSCTSSSTCFCGQRGDGKEMGSADTAVIRISGTSTAWYQEAVYYNWPVIISTRFCIFEYVYVQIRRLLWVCHLSACSPVDGPIWDRFRGVVLSGLGIIQFQLSSSKPSPRLVTCSSGPNLLEGSITALVLLTLPNKLFFLRISFPVFLSYALPFNISRNQCFMFLHPIVEFVCSRQCPRLVY